MLMWYFDNKSEACVGVECFQAENLEDYDVLPDRRMVAVLPHGENQLWRFIDNKWVFEWSGHHSAITQIATPLPPKCLISADYDNHLRYWVSDRENGWQLLSSNIEYYDPNGLFLHANHISIGRGEVFLTWNNPESDHFEPSTFLPDGRRVTLEGNPLIWSCDERGSWGSASMGINNNSDKYLEMLPDGSLICLQEDHFQLWTCNEDGSWSTQEFAGHISDVISVRLLSDGSLQSISDTEVLRWGNEQHHPSTPLPQVNLRGSWWSLLMGGR